MTFQDSLIGKKILIVEDSNDLQDLMQLRLTYQGLTCQGAYSVTEALGLVDREHFDLILLDLCLPDYHGIDFIQSLYYHISKGKRQLPPIVVMSGLDDKDVRCYLNEEGILAYLTKPVDTQKLIDLIRDYSYNEACS